MDAYVKRRRCPAPGSISEALDSFQAEVRFYREIAPVVGVRVPACYRAEGTDDGTVLVLEARSTIGGIALVQATQAADIKNMDKNIQTIAEGVKEKSA